MLQRLKKKKMEKIAGDNERCITSHLPGEKITFGSTYRPRKAPPLSLSDYSGVEVRYLLSLR